MFKQIDFSNNKFVSFLIPIVLFVIGIFIFSASELSCDKTSGICTTKSKVFYLKETNQFKISDFKDTETVYHSARKAWYYKVNILLESKGFAYSQEFPCLFGFKHTADDFSNKLKNFISGNEISFTYTYYGVIPLALIGLSVFLLLEAIKPSNCTIEEFYKSINLWIALLILAALFFYLKYAAFDFFNAPPPQDKEYMAFIHRGNQLNKDNNHKSAILAFEQAEKIYNDDFMLYVFKARAYEDNKDWKNLLSTSTKALGLMNNDSASVYIENSRYGKDRNQRKAELLYNVAVAHSHLGNPHEAIRYFTEVINSPHTGYDAAFRRRGKCYRSLGMKKEALADFQTYKAHIIQAIEEDNNNKHKNWTRFDASDIVKINALIDSVK